MKWQATLLLAASASLCHLAIAAEQVQQHADLASGSKVDIRVQRGQVTVKSWDKNQVSINGSLDEQSEGLVFEQRGAKFVIEDKLPRKYSGGRNNGSKLEIYLPKQADVRIAGTSTDFSLSDIRGNIDGNSISGDINLAKLAGDIAIRSVSGAITAEALNGKLSLETVSGDIDDTDSQGSSHYRLVSGDLTAQSQASDVYADVVSGKVALQLSRVEQLKVHAVSGDIKLALDSLSDKAQLDSVSGDIKLHFNQTPDAEFVINGGPSGNISNKLSDDKPQKAKYTHRESLKFQTGSAKANVYITTISGDIRLEK